MHVYFAGIGGVGIGPLAGIAREAGYQVSGYDMATSRITEDLASKGIEIAIGDGLSAITKRHAEHPIDWLVATAALKPNDPILEFARSKGVRISKRDELINQLIKEKHQKLIAVSGTHGKTTTTAMLAWLFKQFEIPESHSIGTRVSFAPSGTFSEDGQCFIYEADEYDRNMLKFRPDVALITSLDYDHPDTYPTKDDYKQAFRQFIQQSARVFMWQRDVEYLGLGVDRRLTLVDKLIDHERAITLPGAHYRQDALLACAVFDVLFPELGVEQIISAINKFPGTERRFERLAPNLYTDYAHHPVEIAATIQMARELSDNVVVVYQPHQNIRQHDIADDYTHSFDGAEHVYWLPTYLSREDQQLPILSPQQLIRHLANPSIAEPATLDGRLIEHIRSATAHGALVIVMGAGDVDGWLREHLAAFNS